MRWITSLLVAVLVLNKCLMPHGYIIDACRAVKCENKDEIPCLEIFPDSQGSKFNCKKFIIFNSNIPIIIETMFRRVYLSYKSTRNELTL
jgi:hypothetical protein